MIRDEGHWEVRWSATGLHPNLGEHQTFALRADPPRRRLGQRRSAAPTCWCPATCTTTRSTRGRPARDLMPTASAVVDALRPFDDTLDPQRLAEAGQLVANGRWT